ncbi:MutH/Sau3AI family endonuclease [Aliarcobacter cryaerophilus]|uniref:MutH/Sau3AI family endonuclease n=1 Tax=Aliarcobacter cryaerophilus TaxID=28198 RepID=UPI003DA59446
MKKKYDENDKNSIVKYAKQLEGKTLKEILPNEIIETMKEDEQGNKGRLGQKIERYFFGYECNSDSLPDFPCGLELKVTPLKVNKNGSISPKERLVCNIINFENIINEQWETSTFLNKNKEMLIIKYIDPMNKNISQLDYKIVDVRIHNILDEDAEQFEKDWNIIVNKIREGKAHQLSESDTKYLGACTKGATAATSLRTQANNHILAKQRAFSFKTAYMKEILNR